MLFGYIAALILAAVNATSAAAAKNYAASPLRNMNSSKQQQQKKKTRIVIGVDGGTESIRACCYDAETGQAVGESCAVPYQTTHPHPGYAEQQPEDWYECLGKAVRRSIKTIRRRRRYEFVAIALDTTCCSVVALDKDHVPLRPCILWMDQRAAPQTQQILEQCRGDPALKVNCGGDGPLSAEWMLPKSLWLQQNEPAVWEAATTICEYQDYLNYRLTGSLTASSCNAAARWHWDGEKCIVDADASDDDVSDEYPGRPMSLYNKLGIPELADKLPRKCLPMGARVGELTTAAAAHLGLPARLAVIQGGPDAFVGMIGLGCIHPGQLCLITGSSHLHCVVTSTPRTARGIWGAYTGAPLPGLNFAEGGQSSTGSIIRWAKGIFGGSGKNDISYRVLDDEAAKIDPGSGGLLALETFQGSRTPITDPRARGALLGLTLSHGRGHIWRALMEAVCFGTRACVEGLARAGHSCDEIILAGGITRSRLWLQMHADVTGIPIVVCENSDAPLLGSAILASVGVGVHASVEDAVKAMVRVSKTVEPNDATAAAYTKLYEQVYSPVANATRPIFHALHQLRGGDDATEEPSTKQQADRQHDVVISPSLLSCDWAAIRSEVHRCLEAGARRLHVDVFDGVFLDSPHALTFGPQMVQAIRESCDSFAGGDGPVILDLHLCVDRPGRYVSPMVAAGGSCFIFQWEAMSSYEEAVTLVRQVASSGMLCGLSINPETNIADIIPLLETGLVHVVDVLAVNPGFAAQVFQVSALEKIRELKHLRDSSNLSFDIMVDGGVNDKTSRDLLRADVDIMVSGSFLFKHPGGMATGMAELLVSK